MITRFSDTETMSDHDRFQAWRSEHQDGAVLMLEAGSRARLHGVRCPHFGGGPPYFSSTDGFGSLTSKPKLCGSESELIEWAAQNSVTLNGCQHCTRDGLIGVLDVEPELERQVEEAETVLARILPDHNDRSLVLKRLLESARIAETIAPSAWGATLFSDGFRLNVGQVEVLVLGEHTLRVNLVAELGVPPVVEPRFVATTYRSMPEPQCAFVGTIAEYAEIEGVIADAHEAFVRRAASTRSGEARSGTPFRRSHHAGLLESARRSLGVEASGLAGLASKTPRATGRTLLLLGGTDEQNGDYSFLLEAARSSSRTVERWSTLKEAQAGDEVWFYFPSPHSAIVASGVALANAEPDENWPYVMPVGQLTWLPRPIALQEIREKFPAWTWAKRARGRTYLPDEIADYLRRETASASSATSITSLGNSPEEISKAGPSPPPRTDYVAYHSEVVMGYTYAPGANGRVTFLTAKSEGVVRRVLGNPVWVVSGTRTKAGTRYHLQGKFRPDNLAKADNAWEISGPGVSPPAPIDVSDEPWLRELLGEQANFSLGLNRIQSASVLSALDSVFGKDPGQSSRAELPDEVPEGTYREGQGVQITVNRYERDASARAACLRHFGPLCQICRIDLSTFYGRRAAGLVHVHHLRPLSQVEGEYEVRPEHDLIPVCPNCHAVVHRSDPPLTPDELRAMIEQARSSRA